MNIDEVLKPNKSRYSPTGNCWVFNDGLDGFVIHAPECSDVGRSWTNSNRCINLRTWRGIFPTWAR